MAASNSAKTLNIIHFNDVYNIVEDNSHKCGGAARFMTLINKLKSLKPEPLIFFSGDFLSPSNMSTVTKGKHMIPIMNELNITCGMIGNHDLDYGNEHCIDVLQQLNYPTLNSNIFTPINCTSTDFKECDDEINESELEPLGKCKTELIISHNGFKIGMIGISENWCNTLPIRPKRGIIYKDFIQQCAKSVAKIRAENELDLVIVLTHSRKANDILLANKIKDIDLILGGHDHLYHVGLTPLNKSLLVKSGCDFKGVTLIQLQDKNSGAALEDDHVVSELNEICLAESHRNLMGLNYEYRTFHYQITRDIEADPKMSHLVQELSGTFFREIEQPLGVIDVSLDTRFEMIRKQEMVSCNLICDIVRNAYRADIVLLCGGGIRSDKIHKKGSISYKDILDLAPFQDPIIVKRISGKNIISAIKHSIMNLPKLDGRFAHVSGLKYVYDSSKQPAERLINVKVCKNECEFEDIEEDKYYTVASRQYTMNGGDGFDSLRDENNEILVGDDSGAPLCVLLRNFFWCVSTINDAIQSMDDEHDDDGDEELMRDIKSSEESMLFKIEPQIEGRIVDVARAQTAATKGQKVSVLSPPRYDKLPSFVNMTRKPERKNCIRAFLANLVN